ncbi:iron complex outermembrane receptor protein [Altererythrobacter atlanticus]|uniref:Vitamin B12 transporter BtuB n=1 Tax=Croceibacterium atlanticum TaxID=1267766 RepID=A0A0F7KS44_9SPHN|nr:TonB-dependent receptor [Croceibacterium atlanticum]AKH42097.1 Vitamin B12 transporter BtuB precursor [Croceibacterium atlanticum]MBB5733333.1 iron complex outermembrane receptor protein [Croceibacterium atlanticum]
MKKHRIICAAGVAASAIAAAGYSPAASAQDAVADKGDPIVVTGTLIRGGPQDAIAPVDVIGAEDLARQGSPSILDITRRLAVSAGVIGDSSQFDPRSQFNQGSASVNLRGFGPQRTLVLLNGRRMVASGAGNIPLVDVNLMPSSAIGRVEILKDGAAATYGSDAIAGVVNFITRTDQQGFLASADYRHIDGSDGDWTAALSWGGDIGPARIFLSGGYQRRNELQAGDRDHVLRRYAENPQGGWSGGGNPGNFDYDATQNGVAFTADEGCADAGAFLAANDLCLSNYLGFTNLVEPEDRFQLFADMELPLGERVELRATALYGHTKTVLSTSPSFLPTIAPSSDAAFGGSGLFVIPEYAPALIDYCARYADASCSTDASGAPQAPALAYPVRFRPMLLSGNPLFDNGRNTARLPRNSDAYQFTGEVRADLGGSLELTGGVTYSEYDRYFVVGDSFVDLLQNAMAGFGGADCAYATAASRAGLTDQELAALAGTNGCSWFNPFSTAIPANQLTGQANPNYAGNGSPVAGLSTQPGEGLVNDVSTIGDFYNMWGRVANTRQWVGDLVLAGGTGISLPGGEIHFALGGQYRRDRYARAYEGGNNLDLYPCPASVLDPDASCTPETGALGFIGSNRDVRVSSDVWAGFAELQLPVTDRLDAQLSARYEDYGGSVGSTFDPQLRIRYRANDWLALRGGVGTTFRGPPPENTAADLVILTFIGGAFRAVDVLANPKLDPESATTWNAGMVADSGPFRASLDYWRYEFSGPIESEPVSGMVAAMFGASGSANCGDPAFAGLEARFTFSGDICSAANVQRLSTYAFNSADVRTSGLDASASYDFALGDAWMQIGASGSYVFEYEVGEVTVEGIAVQSAFDAAGKLNYQTTAYPIPRLKGRAWLQGEWGDHTLRLQLNHVSGYTDQRESIFGPDASLGGAALTRGKHIGAFDSLDLAWNWSPAERTHISLALFNLLDAKPPFARLDQNFDPFTADPIGFTAKLGVSQSF